jgi:hypothetical protein
MLDDEYQIRTIGMIENSMDRAARAFVEMRPKCSFNRTEGDSRPQVKCPAFSPEEGDRKISGKFAFCSLQ